MFGRDMGIDLGTANTLVYVKGKGIVINEPSVVAVDTLTREIWAIGSEAEEMIGRTPVNLNVIRPVRNGVISDFDITEAMLKFYIDSAFTKSFFKTKPRVVICVPSGVTEVEKHAVIEAALGAGAREKHVLIVDEPMAAAIGAGMDVFEAGGNMILDIGGGTSEVAIISMGGIVSNKSVRVAGDDIDAAIKAMVRRDHNIIIGEKTAENIKKSLACAYIDENTKSKEMDVKGRDLVSGLPKSVKITTKDVHDAIAETLSEITDAVKMTLENTPPELSADIIQNGIYIAGGGALIENFDKLLSQRTNMPVHIANDPLTCVAAGTGIIIENPELAEMITSADGSLT
ncbi:MAG: rod shape-determining protein [Firmicutes bacterium]|nr:rod shape-determining protein [Bacillota bacterium]